MFCKEGPRSAWLTDSSMSRFAGKKKRTTIRKMEEECVKTSRKFHSLRNGVACFSCHVGLSTLYQCSQASG